SFEAQALEQFVIDHGAGDDDLGTARADALNLAAFGHRQTRQALGDARHFGARDQRALIASAAKMRRDGGQRSGGAGSGDYIFHAGGGDTIGNAADFTGHQAAQALQFSFAGGVMAQEFVGEPNRSQREADGVADVSALRNGELATAAAQIDHERGGAVGTRTGNQAEVNEARFFDAGDDFDAPSRGRANPLEKRLRIARVAQGAGGDHAHCVGDNLLRRAMKPAQNFHGFGHRFRREKSGAEDAFAQASDFAVFVDRAEASCLQSRNFKANGVRSDIDRGERGHEEGDSLHAGREESHGGFSAGA